MIKALLLDLGNVMLSYDPKAMTGPWVENEADRDLIIGALFAHPDWAKGDDGSLTEAELFENARSRLPARLHPALRQVLAHWPEALTPLPGAEDFLRDMKASGRKVIALSNAPARYAEFKKDNALLALFDGEVISALAGCSKPGPEIFRRALSAFSLSPEECFFVDDLPRNVEGAAAVGIDGCAFDGDFRALRALIEAKSAG